MSAPYRALILVVDDEEGIRRSLTGFLTDEGFRVIAAGDSDAALTRLEEEEPDLVLLDILMPGTDGIATLDRMRSKRPELPVIMVSGGATIEHAVRATKLGAYDFIEKPPAPEKLLITVERALEHARLHRENARLRRSASSDVMVGKSAAMEELRETIAQAAPSNGRVLIQGENGTGKELVAREIHARSKRRDGPFVKMNCAAIHRELVESELFGHERGAFTGAVRMRRGRFELAHGGTLFLDEIGDMGLDVQAKLLRVLEEGEVERVGGSQAIKVSVRVVAATNKDIAAEIGHGRFREDLFYRLSVIPVRVPPLRERSEDIPLIARYYLDHFAREYDRKPRELRAEALPVLTAHPWPGNVRELRNLMERLVIMGKTAPIEEEEVRALLEQSPGGALTSAGPGLPGATRVGEARGDRDASAAGAGAGMSSEVPAEGSAAGEDTGGLRDLVEGYEAGVIREALESSDWNVSEAAKRLKTDRANLHRKMRRLGIERPA